MISFEKELKEMQDKINLSIKAIINLCKSNDLKISKKGRVGDNVLILDFNQSSYDQAKKLIVKGCVEGIGSVTSYDGPKRISIIF